MVDNNISMDVRIGDLINGCSNETTCIRRELDHVRTSYKLGPCDLEIICNESRYKRLARSKLESFASGEKSQRQRQSWLMRTKIYILFITYFKTAHFYDAFIIYNENLN